MVFADKTLTCRDCRSTFLFTAGEQGFYLDRGLLNEPRRCPSCRAGRRRPRVDAAAAPAREMTATVCAACGGAASVPFMPQPDRPVYCADCFQRTRAVMRNA